MREDWQIFFWFFEPGHGDFALQNLLVLLKNETMKYVLICLLLCLRLASAEVPDALPEFLLVAPESMAEAPVNRVRDWMRAQLHYEVRVLRLPDWEGKTASEQMEALEELPVDGIIVTVVMADRLEEGKHAVILPERMIGFIQVPLLYETEEEQQFRRLERQAMRIAGFSLGVPPQPMPFCALAPYATLEELDRMGRGFSPPAMAQYRARLVELDIPLSPDAERLLPNVRVNPPTFPETHTPLEETN